jgi:hypothetical protein
MNTMIAVMLVLGLCSCADDRLAGGGTDTEVSILAGVVKSGGVPVYGATVQIVDNTSLSDITDSSGAFSIADVPYGDHTIHAYKNIPGDGLYQYYSNPINVSSAYVNVGTLPITKSPVAKRGK